MILKSRNPADWFIYMPRKTESIECKADPEFLLQVKYLILFIQKADNAASHVGFSQINNCNKSIEPNRLFRCSPLKSDLS